MTHRKLGNEGATESGGNRLKNSFVAAEAGGDLQFCRIVTGLA